MPKRHYHQRMINSDCCDTDSTEELFIFKGWNWIELSIEKKLVSISSVNIQSRKIIENIEFQSHANFGF